MSDEKRMYVGLDMGTGSVGWAVTDENYHLKRAKGKDLWGVRLFDGANTSAERRSYRISRRRRQRETARLALLKDYFSDAVNEVDPGFFHRLEESAYFLEDRSEDNQQKFALFHDADYTDKDYYDAYPTVFHLRKSLIETGEPKDVRMLYLALANMFKHRGHFLNTTLSAEESEADIKAAYQAFCEKAEMFDIEFPEGEETAKQLEECLSTKGLSRSRIAEKVMQELDITKKEKAKAELVKLMCGCSAKLSTIYGEEIIDEEHKKQAICFRDLSYEQKEQEARDLLGDEYFELIELVKEIHDIGLLANVMKGEKHLTFARVDTYEKHKKDLAVLKAVLKEYDKDAYDTMFRVMKAGNYSAYVGSVNSDKCSEKEKQRRNQGTGRSQEELYKSIKTAVSKCPQDDERVQYILVEMENEQFLPKQLTAANGVIPNQVYVREMKAILKKAEQSHVFLKETDESGLTVSERILQLFSFQIPYYVGPLGINGGENTWAVRKEAGRVLPWNFEEKIDTAASAEKFISRMVRRCTYLNQEQTLPKNSLLYEKFMVLNELNNLRIYGEPVSVEVKQGIYTELFENGKKVTLKNIVSYLQREGLVSKGETTDCLSGIDQQGFKSSLGSYGKMKAAFEKDSLTDSEKEAAEKVIFWKTVYGDDKKLIKAKIEEELSDQLSEYAKKRILGYRFDAWGNLSKEFLELLGESKKDGKTRSIIQALWETNDNLMQLLGSDYTYRTVVEQKTQKAQKPLEEWTIEDLDGLYLSAPVKRMVWQTMKILEELREVTKQNPDRIFVEMAREKGKEGDRKDSRKKKLLDLYASLKKEGAAWREEIEQRSEADFRIKKLYLYYIQMGKDIYTGKMIDIHELFNDNLYDIDHIYPRHFVKDDSIENNLVLALKTDNAHKSDTFPLEKEVRDKQSGYWKMLCDKGFITKEKYQRLTRKTPFTEQERADFISRQLVETRQGTKAITQIISQAFPDTKVVFSKAGEVSNFRHRFDFVKVRSVNDLHHAKDAYLNIVVGNTYYVKFNNNPLNFVREAEKCPKDSAYKYHMDKIFYYTVKRGDEIAWNAEKGENGSLFTVRKVMAKNSPLITKRSYIVHSGITAKETIYSADTAKAEGYIPVKSANTPLADVTKYGGRTSITNMCYTLAEYKVKGKRVLSLEALPVYLGNIDSLSEEDIVDYLKKSLAMEYKGKEVTDIVVKYKTIRYRTKIKLNGHYYYLAGKTGNQIYLENAASLYLGKEAENYIHKLEKAIQNNYYKEKDNDQKVIITKENNQWLYLMLVNSMCSKAYISKKNAIRDFLKDKSTKFCELELEDQCLLIQQIVKWFQLDSKGVDLRSLDGSVSAGVCLGSKKLSVVNEAILIQTSVTGLLTHEVDLLAL